MTGEVAFGDGKQDDGTSKMLGGGTGLVLPPGIVTI